MKQFQSRAYVNRLKGHKDVLVGLWSEYGLNGGVLYSLSQDGGFRQWSLIEKEIIQKRQLNRPTTNPNPKNKQQPTEEDMLSIHDQTNFFNKLITTNEVSNNNHEQQLDTIEEVKDKNILDGLQDKITQKQETIQEEQEKEEQEDKEATAIEGKQKVEKEEEGWAEEGKEQKCSKNEKISSAVIMSNSVIYCGYESGEIIGWSLKEDNLIDTYIGHTQPVTTLTVLNPRILMSSANTSLRLWDTTTGTTEHILNFPTDIDHIQVHSNHIYLIHNHYAILILKGSDYSLVKQIDFSHYTTCLLLEVSCLFIATDDHIIRVFNRSDNTLSSLATIDCYQSRIECMAIVRKDQVYQDNTPAKYYKKLLQYDSYLIVGLDSGDIHVYQDTSHLQGQPFQLLEIFQGHNDKVSQLVFADSHFLYSASYDMSIRNWDLREMTVRIRDRYIMFREDVQSTVIQAYNLAKAKKKKKKKKKKGKK